MEIVNLKRYVTSLLAVFFCLICLLACKVGKNYDRPQLNLPDTFKNANESLLSSYTDTSYSHLNVGKLSWREFFEDSVLVALIDSALNNNFDLEQVAREMEVNRQAFLQSRTNFFPQLNGVFEKRRENHSSHWYSNPNANYYEESSPPSRWYVNRVNHYAAMEASWEPDIWGKFRREKEAALAQFLQSDELRKAVQTALVADVASSYYNLMMLKEQLKVAQSNLKLNDSTLNIVRLQFQAGHVTSLAITQTESQKLIAASLIPQLERDIEIERNNLSQLLGNYPNDGLFVERELEDVKLMSNVSSGVPLELIKNRPDVAASELALIEANARVGVAQAMRYPALNIVASYGLDAMNLSNLLSPNALFGVFIGTLTQPIFQNRRLKTNYEIALVERDISEIVFRKNVLNAVREVSNELITINKLEEELFITEERLVNSRKAVKDSDLLFKSGFANYLEIINAQSNALESELDLVSVRMQLLISNIELYRILGGGWQ